MAFELAQQASAPGVPDPRHAVVAHREDVPRVGAEARAADAPPVDFELVSAARIFGKLPQPPAERLARRLLRRLREDFLELIDDEQDPADCGVVPLRNFTGLWKAPESIQPRLLISAASCQSAAA